MELSSPLNARWLVDRPLDSAPGLALATPIPDLFSQDLPPGDFFRVPSTLNELQGSDHPTACPLQTRGVRGGGSG